MCPRVMAEDRAEVQLSIISPTGYTASTCGYCTAPGSGKRSQHKSAKSYGIWAHRLSPYHYQSLIDRGWRRSGQYIYKPDLLRSCCAQMPIRLEARNYKPSKSHRRALTNLLFRVRQTKLKPAKWKGRWSISRDWDIEQRWNEITPFNASQSDASTSSLAWADSVAGPITRKLQVRLALAATSDEKYQLFRKYQAKIHGESEHDISDEPGFRRFLVDTSLVLTWPSTGKPLTRSEQVEWRAKSFDPACLPDQLAYGCYHQEYRLEEKLIAVGVLDILPNCVSSVYVFYDPEYSDWELGKVSALQEIGLTLRLSRLKAMSKVAHYYMGFYIHTCQKMKYKAMYRPSQVLDCDSNTWHNLTDVTKALDAKRFFDWSDDQSRSQKHDGSPDQTLDSDAEQEQEEHVVRLPTRPRPPPGMLDATAILKALEQTLHGACTANEPDVGWDLLQHVMVLEVERQAEGIKPLLISNVLRDHAQSRRESKSNKDAELVQVVECVAALASAQLVAETILFI